MFKTEPARQTREQDQENWYIPLSIDTAAVSDPETSPVPATFTTSPTNKPPTPPALPLGAAKSPKSPEGGPWWNRLVKKDEGKATTSSNKRWSRGMDAFVGAGKKVGVGSIDEVRRSRTRTENSFSDREGECDSLAAAAAKQVTTMTTLTTYTRKLHHTRL